MKHEQIINIDQNWNDEMTTEEMDARNKEAENKAMQIVGIVRDPSKGIHAYHYETMCGWAVLVSTEVMSMGEGDLKRAVVATGYMFQRNAVNHNTAREVLQQSGMSCDEVDRLIVNADKKSPDVIVPQ